MLSAELTSEQILEWFQFNRLNPPPHKQVLVMLAKIGAAICQSLGNAKSQSSDFLTDFEALAKKSLAPRKRKKQRNALDLARQFRAMGFPVVIARPGGSSASDK